MKFLGLLLLFTSAFSYADCRVQNTVIPDGETKTLFQENGSLTSHRTQDQDGLGTCYANTTSVVLKSVLPGNPDISYTHAAVQGSTRGILQDWRQGGRYHDLQDGQPVNFTHGGSICNTVDALKNNGGACPSTFSVTENKTLMDPNTQQRLFYSVGRYFDVMNSIQNDPAQFESHREKLAIALEAVNLQRDSLVQECQEQQSKESDQELPLGQAIGGLIGNMMLRLGDSACDRQMFQSLRGLLDPSSTIEEDRIVAKPMGTTIQRFRRAIASNSTLHQNLKNFAKFGSLSNSFKSGIAEQLLPIIQNFVNENVPSCGGSELMNGEHSEEYAGRFRDATREQFRNPCAAILAQPSASNFEALQCFRNDDFELFKNALAPLLEINGSLGTTQLQNLLNTRNENADQMRDILFPECETASNLIPMDSLTCRSDSMCSGSQDQMRINNSSYSGPPGSCLDGNAAKTLARTRVLDGVKNNRAIGISVCTAFLHNPSVRTNFCNDMNASEPNVAHDVSISGYRCVGDKIEYQVVNSWGTSCPPGSTHSSGSIKCDPSDNGRFWVDEEVIVNNATGITEVKGEN